MKPAVAPPPLSPSAGTTPGPAERAPVRPPTAAPSPSRRSTLHTLLHNPRRLSLRRLFFQVHLWVGIALSLYLIVIALSGSVLVFEEELTRTSLPPGLSQFAPAHTAPLPTVLANLHALDPSATPTQLILPYPRVPAFQITATGPAHQQLTFVADPTTGQVLPQPRTWLAVVHDLHLYLLLGPKTGILLNGIGAAGLLVLALTGLALWWPGLRLIARRLVFNPRARWRRLNFDLHNSIGIWTLALVSWWAISGVYFTWYREVVAVIDAVSPLRGMRSPSPASLSPVPPGTHTTLPAVLAAIHAASPQGRLFALSDPALHTPELYAEVDLRSPGDFSHRDIVRLRSADAHVLSVWHYGQNHTLGDWVLWSMHPLHFGTLWGLPFKILWCLAGVLLAVLTVTGLVLYWNRFLHPRWQALRAPR